MSDSISNSEAGSEERFEGLARWTSIVVLSAIWMPQAWPQHFDWLRIALFLGVGFACYFFGSLAFLFVGLWGVNVGTKSSAPTPRQWGVRVVVAVFIVSMLFVGFTNPLPTDAPLECEVVPMAGGTVCQ